MEIVIKMMKNQFRTVGFLADDSFAYYFMKLPLLMM